jgi:CheY-like chemotaxis protein
MKKQIKILVADDELIGRQLLEAILFPEGYEIIFAEDGEKALNAANKYLPDFILLDVMMPKMDGFEVCKRIREQKDTAHIPVFLITALDDRDSRIRGIDAGADDYISKPFDRIEILAKIKNSTTLLQYRQLNIPSEEQVAAESILALYDEKLFSCLTDILILQSQHTENERFNIYRSIPVSKSHHAFIETEGPAGIYYYMLSNKLNGNDAILMNCIIASLIKDHIIRKEKRLIVILKNTIEKLQEIATKYNILKLHDTTPYIAIVFFDIENNDVVASGLNQILYAASKKPALNIDSKNISYQPYYLMGNQDITLRDSNNIFVFSENIHNSLTQQDLVSFLNNHFISGHKRNLSLIMPQKLNQSDDNVVVNLSFKVLN